ncbi:MAG: hypothetical protein H7839_23350 [Magnetococcus sp. YQC-5]
MRAISDDLQKACDDYNKNKSSDNRQKVIDRYIRDQQKGSNFGGRLPSKGDIIDKTIEPLKKEIERILRSRLRESAPGDILGDPEHVCNTDWDLKNAINYNPPKRDPLAIDLDGNGIETISVENGVRFDQGHVKCPDNALI